MPRKGENIYKRKDGRWEGRFIKGHIDGKIRYGTVYAKSYKEVREKLEDAKRVWGSQAPVPGNPGSLVKISAEWLDEVSHSLKESSLHKYEDILHSYILPAFGTDELSEITNDRLITFANYHLSEGGVRGQGLAPSTVSEILSVMNCIRTFALRHNYAVVFTAKCVSVRRDRREIRVLSVSEEERLIHYLHEHMDLTALGVLFSLATGIRIGELCALNWNDISLSEQQVLIHKTMQRIRCREGDKKTKVQISRPKSDCSVRMIPLPGNLPELLRRYYTKDTFFLTCDSERFVEPRTMENRFRRILDASGICYMKFHSLRHTFATRCIEAGFDIKCLSEILGHANVDITLNRYVHPSMELKRENMTRISHLFLRE